VRNRPVAVETSSFLKASSVELKRLMAQLETRVLLEDTKQQYRGSLVSTASQTGDFLLIDNLKKENDFRVGQQVGG
jgi:hypothetical protein